MSHVEPHETGAVTVDDVVVAVRKIALGALDLDHSRPAFG